MIQTFVSVMVPVFIIFFTGWLTGLKFNLHNKTLSTLSIYILTPSLVFHAISRYENLFQSATLKVFAIVSIVIIITISVVEITSRFLSISPSLKTMIMLTLALANTGNWGLPVNQNAYGNAGFAIAIIVLVIMAVYSNTLGVILSASDQRGFKKSLKILLRLPLFYALILGLIFNFFHIPIPPLFFKPIRTLADVAIPFNLLLLGIHLSNIKITKNLPLVLTLSIVKLFIIPIIAFFTALLFGLRGTYLKVTITQLGMPTAVYAAILSGHFDHREQAFAGQMVLVSTFLSLFSLSFIIRFLQNYF